MLDDDNRFSFATIHQVWISSPPPHCKEISLDLKHRISQASESVFTFDFIELVWVWVREYAHEKCLSVTKITHTKQTHSVSLSLLVAFFTYSNDKWNWKCFARESAAMRIRASKHDKRTRILCSYSHTLARIHLNVRVYEKFVVSIFIVVLLLCFVLFSFSFSCLFFTSHFLSSFLLLLFFFLFGFSRCRFPTTNFQSYGSLILGFFFSFHFVLFLLKHVHKEPTEKSQQDKRKEKKKTAKLEQNKW